MSKREEYLKELLIMQRTLGRGFIDPFVDLGIFNRRLMEFNEPVECLRNKYTGDPYTPYWQNVIEEMRKVFVNYQRELIATRVSIEEKGQYMKDKVQKEKIRKIVVSYLTLGFSFKEISKKVGYTEKYLRRNFRRSDHNQTSSVIILHGKDLERGVQKNLEKLPKDSRASISWCLVNCN